MGTGPSVDNTLGTSAGQYNSAQNSLSVYIILMYASKFAVNMLNDFSNSFTGTQLLIVIIDATWNVNECYYEVSYASARSLRMRRSTSSALGP